MSLSVLTFLIIPYLWFCRPALAVPGSLQKITFILSNLDADSRSKLEKRLLEMSYGFLHQERENQRSPTNQFALSGEEITPQSLYLPVSLIASGLNVYKPGECYKTCFELLIYDGFRF